MTETIRIKLLSHGLTMIDLARECEWSPSYLYRVLGQKKPPGAVAKIEAATKALIERAR